MASNVLFRDLRPRWRIPVFMIMSVLGASVVAAETADRPNPRAVRITANEYDQFWISGTINGKVVAHWLIDTGAHQTFLPKVMAMELGLKNLKYTDRHMTANGSTMDAPTHLDSLEVAGVTMPNFAAEVGGGKNEISLLGMTWLKHFDVSISKGVMILTPKDI